MHINPQHSSASKLKLTESCIGDIHNNPLNTSTSKMQYSIPKSKRFSENKTNTNEYLIHPNQSKSSASFYDLPDIKSNRSTSFGYGNKINLAKTNGVTPSPLNYTINGEFDQMKNKKNGITFGAGRDIVKNVNTFGIKPYKMPGPQDYQPIKSTTELSPPKYSFSARTIDMREKWPRSIPGPGQYNTIEVTKQNHNLTLSKFQSSPAISFSKHKRIADYEEKMRTTKVPGPGEYKMDTLDETTTRFLYDGGRRFGKGERRGIVNKSITPGPGAYKLFSEFIY